MIQVTAINNLSIIEIDNFLSDVEVDNLLNSRGNKFFKSNESLP